LFSFSAPDYYSMDELLSEEQRNLRGSVREWVDREFRPYATHHHRAATFPESLIPGLATLGVFGATLQGYGFPGRDAISHGIMMQELERGDSALRSFASVQSELVIYPIFRYGSKDQRERWLPGLRRGEIVGCFGLTEPAHGSDPAGLEMSAIQDGDDYVLNGTKLWITNGPLADIALVWAKDGSGEIGGYVVERGTPGFRVKEIEGKFSMRIAATGELSFRDCRIPRSNKLPEARGLRAALSCLNKARYSIAWGAVGAAMACYDYALQYARERQQFDRPIAGFQLVQQKLAWMVTEITKAQLLAFRLGQLKDAGAETPQQISMAKMNNAAIALQTARMARDILGAQGIVDDHPVIRHMINLETVSTYEGTHDIHTLVIGRDITGVSAFGNDL
jgi:glutaryl-CoA dehydrogenase